MEAATFPYADPCGSSSGLRQSLKLSKKQMSARRAEVETMTIIRVYRVMMTSGLGFRVMMAWGLGFRVIFIIEASAMKTIPRYKYSFHAKALVKGCQANQYGHCYGSGILC